MCGTRHAQTEAWMARGGGVSGQPEKPADDGVPRALAFLRRTSPCGQLDPNALKA